MVDTTGAGDTFTGVLAAAWPRAPTSTHAVACAAGRGVRSRLDERSAPCRSIPAPSRSTRRTRPTCRLTRWMHHATRCAAARSTCRRRCRSAPDADLTVLDEAKIFAAPDDPADWPRWRDALRRWRREARERTAYDGRAYDDPDAAWAAVLRTSRMVWLWDEALYDCDARAVHVDASCSASTPSSAGSTRSCCGTPTR